MRALFAVLLVACMAAPARAAGEYRTVEVESLRITIDTEWGARTAPGYLPVRFDITNLAEARVVEIVGQGTRFFRVRGATPVGLAIRQEVRLARGDRVRLTVPVPVYADSENIRFEIREDGRTIERFNYTGVSGRTRAEDAPALIVADASSAFGQAAAAWPRKITGPPGAYLSGTVIMGPSGTPRVGGGPVPMLDFVLDPSRLPDNWLGFTSLRAVVIGPQEWERLNDAQKRALLTWTACGGDLLFVDGSLPLLFPAAGAPQQAAPDSSVRAYFFGRIHLPSMASITSAGLASTLSGATALQDPNWALPANRSSDWGVIAARGFRLPIPGIEGVPARAYLFILIVFSILIGPVNYWLMWRMRQQVLLVLTTPLLAGVFIMLLAGYVLAGEGVGVRGRAVTFTMLDQGRKQAATRASLSLYAAGMTPGGGLRFARDEAVYPIGPDGTGSRESQMLDLTEAQRFAAGGIQARSPTNLEVIGFRPARERLGVDREAGGPSVLNGLGEPITALILHDGGTVYHLARALAQGQKARLEPGPLPPSAIKPPGPPLGPRFEHLFANPPAGSFLAVLERSPFFNAGVQRVDERDSFHVVFGWIGGQP